MAYAAGLLLSSVSATPIEHQIWNIAIGFGIATAVYIGYALFEAYRGSTLGVHEAVVVLMVAWSAGQLIAVARYR